MSTRVIKPIEFDDFRTGLHTQSSIFADLTNVMSPTFGMRAAQDLLNMVVTENGITTAPGYRRSLTNAITDEPTVTGIYEYKIQGLNAATYFIVTAGTKVYKKDGAALTELYDGLTAGKRCRFATYENVVLIMNGFDDVLEYDGTTCAAVVFNDPDTIWDGAKPSFAEVFRDRVFYSGDRTQPYRVWTPQPGTYSDFDNSVNTVDSFDVSVGDGEKITMLRNFTKDILIIYKQGRVSRLAGSNPFGSAVDAFRIEEVADDVGCVAGDTVVSAGGDHYFLSVNAYKKLSAVEVYGDVSSTDPTYAIQDAFENNNFNQADIENAFATFLPALNQIYLHVPTGSETENDKVYVIDIKTGGIMPRSDIRGFCGGMVERKYYTGSYEGQIHEQLFGDSYDGSTIDKHWESKWLAIGGLGSKKRFRYLRIHFETEGLATVTVQWSIMKKDGSVKTITKSVESGDGSGWDFGNWDEAEFDAGADTVFEENNLGRGAAIKIRIINNNANEHFTVRKIEIGVQNQGKVAA